MDLNQHIANRNRFARDELIKYAGKYVAWSADGTQILASAEDLAQLAEVVDSSAYDPDEVVLSFVPAPDEVFLGGSILTGGCGE